METFDLVNEKDEVIGETTKEKSHKNGDIHRLVAIYVFTHDGRLYLQDHKKSERFDHSIGGHARKDESYDLAAKREAEEELRIKFPLSKLATIYSDERDRGNNIRHYYALYKCIVPKSWKFQPTEEVKKLVLKSMEEITILINTHPELFTLGFINTMKEYCRIKKNKA